MAGLLIAAQDFIRAEAAKPFRWGETDCSATVSRWIQQNIGFSPLAHFGRVHSNEAEARQWLSEPGSIAVAVNRVLRAAGLLKTKEPQAGDVGLVAHDSKLCMAIHAGNYWFTRDETGLIGTPLGAVWKAWKVN